MNVCIVSTFDGTTDDFMEMFNKSREQTPGVLADYDIGVIREGKIVLMLDVIDMEKMQEVLTSEEMQAWDTKFNCVDVVYSLDKM